MAPEMNRREFLAATPAAFALAGHALSQSPSPAAASGLNRAKIETFDYQSVRLRPSRWKEQVDQARAFYLSISNDDILHGHREAAGLPAPGAQLGGWCSRNSNTVFGQWLSGMSRLSRATGDAQLRDKAIALLGECTKTLKADGDTGMRHYPFDKLVCGLVDLQIYADHAPATGVLERITAFASKTFDRSNNLADPTHNTADYGEPHQIANETPANRPVRAHRSRFFQPAHCQHDAESAPRRAHLPCAPAVRTSREHLVTKQPRWAAQERGDLRVHRGGEPALHCAGESRSKSSRYRASPVADTCCGRCRCWPAASSVRTSST